MVELFCRLTDNYDKITIYEEDIEKLTFLWC